MRNPEFARVQERHRSVGDAWKCYIRDIENTRILGEEEEKTLAVRAQNGDPGARDQLVIHNLRFVVSLCSKYSRHGVPVEDLVGEGNLGLLEAVKHYDPERGVRFLTYARWWIRRAILHYLTNRSRLIRIPEDKVNKMLKINREQRACEHMGAESTDRLVASRLKIKLSDLEKIKKLNYVTLSLEASTGMQGTTWKTPTLEKEMAVRIDGELEEALRNAELRQAMQLLDARELDVLSRHFGFEGKRQSLQKIGEDQGISRERVRQIKQRALMKLRKSDAGPRLEEYLYP